MKHNHTQEGERRKSAEYRYGVGVFFIPLPGIFSLVDKVKI